MPVTTRIIQKLQFEIDFDDVTGIAELFTKLHKYRKPAGYKHDGLDLTKADKDYIKQFYNQFEHVTVETPDNADQND